jgi:hypothetical protein
MTAMTTAASGELMLDDLTWFIVVRELMTDDELGFRGKRSAKLGLANDPSADVIRDGYGIADLRARDVLRRDPYLRSPIGDDAPQPLQDYLVARQVRRFAPVLVETGLDLTTRQWFEWVRMLNANTAPGVLDELETATRGDTLRQLHDDFTTRDSVRHAEAMERLCYIVLEHFLVSSFYGTKEGAYHVVERLATVRGITMQTVFSYFWFHRVVGRIDEQGVYLEKPEGLHAYLQKAINGHMTFARRLLENKDHAKLDDNDHPEANPNPSISLDDDLAVTAKVDRALAADGRLDEYGPERQALDRETLAVLLQMLVRFTESSRRNNLQLLIILFEIFNPMPSKQIAATLESWRTDYQSLDEYLWEVGYDLDGIIRLRTLIIKGFVDRIKPIDEGFVDVLLSRTREDLRRYRQARIERDS